MTTYREAILKMYNHRTAYDTEEGTQHPRQAQKLVDTSPLKPGDTVLDVATGTGLVAFAAAQRIGPAGRVIAFDLTECLLEQARQKLRVTPGANIEFQHNDAMTACFPPGSFDLIYCCEALVLFEDPLAVLAGWHQFLKPTGCIAFTCTHENSYFGVPLQEAVQFVLGPTAPPHMHQLLGTEEKIIRALLSTGFQPICIQSEPGGGFKPLDQVHCNRDFLSMMFKGAAAITGLTKEQSNQVCHVFHTAVTEAETSDGVWQDTGLYFVYASKARPV